MTFLTMKHLETFWQNEKMDKETKFLTYAVNIEKDKKICIPKLWQYN